MTKNEQAVLRAMQRPNRVSEWLIDELTTRAKVDRNECISALRSLIKRGMVSGEVMRFSKRNLCAYKLTNIGAQTVDSMSVAVKVMRGVA